VLKGILPIAKSIAGDWGFWRLPGHGEQYADCGSWRYRGCLNVEEHVNDGLFESIAGKAYIEFYRRACLRAECPVCYEKWAGKEAGKIEYRLASVGRRMGLVIHVVLKAVLAFFTLIERMIGVSGIFLRIFILLGMVGLRIQQRVTALTVGLSRILELGRLFQVQPFISLVIVGCIHIFIRLLGSAN